MSGAVRQGSSCCPVIGCVISEDSGMKSISLFDAYLQHLRIRRALNCKLLALSTSRFECVSVQSAFTVRGSGKNLKAGQEYSVRQQTLCTFNQLHIGDIAEVAQWRRHELRFGRAAGEPVS